MELRQSGLETLGMSDWTREPLQAPGCERGPHRVWSDVSAAALPAIGSRCRKTPSGTAREGGLQELSEGPNSLHRLIRE